MKVRVEIDEGNEDEVVIRCKKRTREIEELERAVTQVTDRCGIVFYKGSCEFYLSLENILFFETASGALYAHTASDTYTVKSKLFLLEQTLPECFIRASKSTLVNLDCIYSIDKNITSFSTVSFSGTHKQVFVSRNYYKPLKQRLDIRRKNHES